LRSHDDDIAAAFAAAAGERWTLLTASMPQSVSADDEGVDVVLPGGRTVRAEQVLVATGRVSNSDRLAVEKTGVEVDTDGFVVVDEYQRTTAPGIFALGDVSSRWELKHVANHEMRVVKHNLAHPDAMIRADHRFVPSAVFTEPQIATVGLTESQAVAAGLPHKVVRHDYAGTAAGWAREDRTGFVKIIADPGSGLLLGVHVIGPEAATVIQPAIQAMSFGQTAQQVASGQYWIHPALTEVLENALLKV
jgi:mycothione reductase